MKTQLFFLLSVLAVCSCNVINEQKNTDDKTNLDTYEDVNCDSIPLPRITPKRCGHRIATRNIALTREYLLCPMNKRVLLFRGMSKFYYSNYKADIISLILPDNTTIDSLYYELTNTLFLYRENDFDKKDCHQHDFYTAFNPEMTVKPVYDGITFHSLDAVTTTNQLALISEDNGSYQYQLTKDPRFGFTSNFINEKLRKNLHAFQNYLTIDTIINNLTNFYKENYINDSFPVSWDKEKQRHYWVSLIKKGLPRYQSGLQWQEMPDLDCWYGLFTTENTYITLCISGRCEGQPFTKRLWVRTMGGIGPCSLRNYEQLGPLGPR